MVSHLGSPNLRCLAGSAKSLRAVRAVARVATKLRTTLDLYIYTYIYNMDLLATPEFETTWIFLYLRSSSTQVDLAHCGHLQSRKPIQLRDSNSWIIEPWKTQRPQTTPNAALSFLQTAKGGTILPLPGAFLTTAPLSISRLHKLFVGLRDFLYGYWSKPWCTR